MIKSLTQPVDNGAGGTVLKTSEYGLDPQSRIDTVTSITGTGPSVQLRYRFSDSTDSPTSILESGDGATWTATRYVSLPGSGLTMSITADIATFQLADLRGNVVATQTYLPGPLTLDGYTDTDEYGVPAGSRARYGWLGSSQRPADAVGGFILMGARVYNPATGLFLTMDPVPGGNVTSYTYPEDPINHSDVSGRCDIENEMSLVTCGPVYEIRTVRKTSYEIGEEAEDTVTNYCGSTTADTISLASKAAATA